MRAAYGWTQAELAAKLGVAVQTVGRWESFDPPRGPTLERLAVFAEQEGYAKGADFRNLMDAERGIQRPLWFGVETEEESHIVVAVLETLRRPQWAHLRKQLKQDLKPVLDAWAFGFKEQRRLLKAISEPLPKAAKATKKGKK
jgi:transcriptional regulator with XRE-family HTH domain